MKLSTITLCVLALTGGCQRESGDATSAKSQVRHAAPVAAQRGPTVEELTAGMVEASTQGKSQTPVGLKFDLLQRPVRGEPLEITIALLPREPAEPVTVEVSAPESLQMLAGETKFEFSSVEPEQVYRRKIRLTPMAEGVFLLTLTVNLRHDQLADTRVFSLPVIVGSTAPPTPAATANPPSPHPASPTG
jgi:hypothetical protein